MNGLFLASFQTTCTGWLNKSVPIIIRHFYQLCMYLYHKITTFSQTCRYDELPFVVKFSLLWFGRCGRVTESWSKWFCFSKDTLFFYFFIFLFSKNFILADQLPPLFKYFIYTQFYNLTQPVIFLIIFDQRHIITTLSCLVF